MEFDVRLGGLAHGIVTKIVHKTMQGGLEGVGVGSGGGWSNACLI